MFFSIDNFHIFSFKNHNINKNKLFPFYQYFQHSMINTSHFYLKIKNTGQEIIHVFAFWWEACFWKKKFMKWSL